jgi:integrase
MSGTICSKPNTGRDQKTKGKPLSPGTRASMISAIRTFFRDAQENEWIPRRFDPAIALAYPRSLQGLLGPNPRLIEDDVWAKLMWAGLTLQPTDVPEVVLDAHYPFELIHALALVWLFSGLRSNEICRLRVGCVRWLRRP